MESHDIRTHHVLLEVKFYIHDYPRYQTKSGANSGA